MTKDMANGGWRPSWSPEGNQIAFLFIQGANREAFFLTAFATIATKSIISFPDLGNVSLQSGMIIDEALVIFM